LGIGHVVWGLLHDKPRTSKGRQQSETPRLTPPRLRQLVWNVKHFWIFFFKKREGGATRVGPLSACLCLFGSAPYRDSPRTAHFPTRRCARQNRSSFCHPGSMKEIGRTGRVTGESRIGHARDCAASLAGIRASRDVRRL